MALPTLSLEFAEGRTFDVLVSDPMSGYFERRRTNDVTQRAFDIAWPLIDAADVTALEADFDTAKGGAGTATLTHPSEGDLTVRFEEDRLSVQRVSATKYQAGIRVAVEPPGSG